MRSSGECGVVLVAVHFVDTIAARMTTAPVSPTTNGHVAMALGAATFVVASATLVATSLTATSLMVATLVSAALMTMVDNALIVLILLLILAALVGTSTISRMVMTLILTGTTLVLAPIAWLVGDGALARDLGLEQIHRFLHFGLGSAKEHCSIVVGDIFTGHGGLHSSDNLLNWICIVLLWFRVFQSNVRRFTEFPMGSAEVFLKNFPVLVNIWLAVPICNVILKPSGFINDDVCLANCLLWR
jgi:hypothetical protein